MRRLRILTWHVHGSYLSSLVQAPHDFFLPVKPGYPTGYGGKLPGIHWPDNVQDIPATAVREQEFDCILFQSSQNYLHDQYEILSNSQRQLPKIYLEHDPPREHPTDTRHPFNEPKGLLVHVTGFNQLMWDNGNTPTEVIEHGVQIPPGVSYTGELAKGLVVINGLKSRGRRLGLDIFERVREQVPLDLVGMGSEALGGLGEIPCDRLPEFMAQYRFFFHPVRYTSLGMAVCEAMMVGLPIIGLATTELVNVVENGISGYIDTHCDRLIASMQRLLRDPDEAQHLSYSAQRTAQLRFNIQRFIQDWDQALHWAIAHHHKPDQKSAIPTVNFANATMGVQP